MDLEDRIAAAPKLLSERALIPPRRGKEGEPPRYGFAYAVPCRVKRRYRFIIKYNDDVVAKTPFYGTVWKSWKVDIPIEFCFETDGLRAIRTPRAQEERQQGRQMLRKYGYRIGDVVSHGARFGIIQAIEVEKIPLSHRIKLLIREIRLHDEASGIGRIFVLVNDEPRRSEWLWTDERRIVEGYAPYWKLVGYRGSRVYRPELHVTQPRDPICD